MTQFASWRQDVEEQLQESAEVKRMTAASCSQDILRVAETIAASLAAGGKLLVCGNGGSAADAQHIAAELVGRLAPGRERQPLAAIALTTDSSALTAVGNDYGFEAVFARQVEALGRRRDVLMGISTSGESENVVQAVISGRTLGLRTVALLGCGGGRLRSLVDVAIVVPSAATARIQEAHIAIGHVICDVVERMLLLAEEKKGGRAHVLLER